MSEPIRLLAFGYYDDFSRFFLSLKKVLTSRSEENKVFYIANNLSGYLYWKLRDSNVRLSFLNGRSFLKSDNLGLDHEKLYDCLKYHEKENTFDKNKKKYLNRAIKYYHFFCQNIEAFKPNRVIISGDSRIAGLVLKLVCIEKKIDYYFFEQGPFSTTFLDREGVNANASISHFDVERKEISESDEQVKKIESFINRAKQPRYKRNLTYRLLDILINTNPLNLFVPIDIKERSLWSYFFCKIHNRKNSEAIDRQIAQNNQVILLGLQVPDDVNFRIHCPAFLNHTEILQFVLSSVPLEGYTVIVREHPKFRGAYEQSLYELVSSDERIILDSNSDIQVTYAIADKIILNNSMMGVEFLLKFKPIYLLGRSYYEKAVENIETMTLENFIKNDVKVEKDKRIQFMLNFCFHYLIQGHYRDQRLDATERVVEILEGH